MTVYQVLSILGVPALFVAFVISRIEIIKAKKDSNTKLKLGLQALLRSQMIYDYNKWSELGYAPIYARENFENCWQNYHGLGANGVMDDIHNKFMALPTDPPKD